MAQPRPPRPPEAEAATQPRALAIQGRATTRAPCGGSVTTGDQGPRRRRRDHKPTGHPRGDGRRDHRPTTRGGGDAARQQAGHPRRRRHGAAKGPRPGDGAATAPRPAADPAMEGPDPARRKPGPAPAAGGGEVDEVRAAGWRRQREREERAWGPKPTSARAQAAAAARTEAGGGGGHRRRPGGWVDGGARSPPSRPAGATRGVALSFPMSSSYNRLISISLI